MKKRTPASLYLPWAGPLSSSLEPTLVVFPLLSSPVPQASVTRKKKLREKEGKGMEDAAFDLAAAHMRRPPVKLSQ